MTLDRKQCIELYDKAACSGQVILFSSADRNDFLSARETCAECPVAQLCYAHVNPEADGFTGTCAGDLYYDGVNVTGKPEAKPPAVFRSEDANLVEIALMLEGNSEEVAVSWYTSSTVMAAFWGLRKRYTANKIAKTYGYAKEDVLKLAQSFDDGATTEFKDFIASQISDA